MKLITIIHPHEPVEDITLSSQTRGQTTAERISATQGLSNGTSLNLTFAVHQACVLSRKIVIWSHAPM